MRWIPEALYCTLFNWPLYPIEFRLPHKQRLPMPWYNIHKKPIGGESILYPQNGVASDAVMSDSKIKKVKEAFSRLLSPLF